MFVEIRTKHLQDTPRFPFIVSTVGKCLHQKPIERPEGHWHHHVLMVEEGEGRVTIGGESFTLSANEGFFCRADVPHAYRPLSKPFRTRWVTFLGAESLLDYYKIGDYFRFSADALLHASTESLEQFCSGNSTVLTRSAAGYSWMVDWLHGCFAPTAPLHVQVRRYLEAHFSEPLTLDQVASAVHISRYALCHHYKDANGQTVMEQLRHIRIAKARQLLQMTETPIEEIGKSCGFESASYFGKIFRQQVGCSPREYRKKQ